MKLTLEEFQQLCAELGFGLTFPEADQVALHAALAKKLGWNRGNGADAVIAAWCRAWEARYNAKPVVDGRDSRAAKNLFDLTGLEAAIDLVDAYLAMNDSFFIARRHNLFTLINNVNAVKLYAEGHGTVTRHELAQADKTQGDRNDWDEVRRRLGKQ